MKAPLSRLHPTWPALVLALLAVGCASRPGSVGDTRGGQPTALDRYVAAPDPSYAWKAVQSVPVDGATVTAIDLTSQTWLAPGEVDRTVWRHWLMVVTPDDVAHSTGLLFISGGSNRDDKPPRPAAEMIAVARATRSVVAELKMVPNQPLSFNGDGEGRYEDDLIAYTWDQYLRTGDERWPARLPMTKAAVRAMDTITEFTSGPAAGAGRRIDRFVVAGGSKRGWTTWTTAAVDPRVVAICPIVIDVLNMEPQMAHHSAAYGGFAEAVGNYVQHDVMRWMGTPEMKALQRIEDPYFYRDRYQLPKLLMNACGDQFFLPDSSQFYFDQLPGPKFLRYVPNADHSLRGSDAYQTLAAWHHVTLNRTPLPEFDWSHGADGSIRVVSRTAPKAVRLWQATNPSTRDFRLEVTGPAWWPTDLADQGGGVYTAQVGAPTAGWTAYMVELTFDVGAAAPLKLTTDVRVTPGTLPHPAFEPSRPSGFLTR